ncbi:phage tail assembly chaperone [Pseudomonas mediterranea]|uniref:phage tail assembly chaperone n=1 Tax=Pseudomonas mediterranea TaxID=183795 RepID=UPI0006D8A1E1|nr:phage tail assembly chaperone [Pseudomonas mediterranea]
MAGIKIAQAPTFSARVSIPRLGDAATEVEFEFKSRTRKELAELTDAWIQRNKADFDVIKEKGEAVTYAEITDASIARETDQVRDVVVGWGFDEQLSHEAIYELVATYPGVADAILKAYREAFEPARLGN